MTKQEMLDKAINNLIFNDEKKSTFYNSAKKTIILYGSFQYIISPESIMAHRCDNGEINLKKNKIKINSIEELENFMEEIKNKELYIIGDIRSTLIKLETDIKYIKNNIKIGKLSIEFYYIIIGYLNSIEKFFIKLNQNRISIDQSTILRSICTRFTCAKKEITFILKLIDSFMPKSIEDIDNSYSCELYCLKKMNFN